MVNIAIEVLVIFAILFLIFFWFFLLWIIKIIKLWRYKPENDKGRRAEESRRITTTGLLQGFVLSEGQCVLSNARPTDREHSITPSGKDSNSPRKVTNPFVRK